MSRVHDGGNREPEVPLNGIRTFVYAARRMSFTTAARDLGVTQGAVSRAIQSLESALGTVLFDRSSRTIELTAAGHDYFVRVAGAMDMLTAASRSIVQDRDGVLSVDVLPTFALRWLIPRLGSFTALHPEVQVDAIIGDGPVNFAISSADIAVRYGTGPWPGAEASLLMQEEVGVFAAPSLVHAAPPLSTPKDLTTRRLLVLTTRPGAWQEYFAAYGVVPPDPFPTSGLEHFFMIIGAAVAGMGYALLPRFLAREEVEAGKLVQVLPQTFRPQGAYYVLHALGRGEQHKVREFKDWLVAETRAFAREA